MGYKACIDVISSFLVTIPVSPHKSILSELTFNPCTRAVFIANKSFLHKGKGWHLIFKYSHTPTNNALMVPISTCHLSIFSTLFYHEIKCFSTSITVDDILHYMQ